MRPLFLAGLLALAAPAAAQNSDVKVVTDIFKQLKDATRNVNWSSRLDMAKKLDVPPPYNGDVKLFYSPDRDKLDFDCEKITDGCDTVFAFNCGETADDFGAVVASNMLWQRGMKDGRIDRNKLAFILAHEMSHVMLSHSTQMGLKHADLYDKWFASKGKDLKAWKTKNEASRYQRQPNGRLSAADELTIEEDVAKFLGQNFEKDSVDQLNLWRQAMEAEADESGDKLMIAAGFMPEKVAGTFMQAEYDRFMKFETSCKRKTEAMPPAKNSTHPSFLERDSRLFWQYYLK